MPGEDDDGAKNKMVNSWDEENLCPNKGRKGRRKGGQKLLGSEGNATKANGERNHGGVIVCTRTMSPSVCSHYVLLSAEAPGTVDKGRPQSSVRTKGRQSNTPTHSSEFSTAFVQSVIPFSTCSEQGVKFKCDIRITGIRIGVKAILICSSAL